MALPKLIRDRVFIPPEPLASSRQIPNANHRACTYLHDYLTHNPEGKKYKPELCPEP